MEGMSDHNDLLSAAQAAAEAALLEANAQELQLRQQQQQRLGLADANGAQQPFFFSFGNSDSSKMEEDSADPSRVSNSGDIPVEQRQLQLAPQQQLLAVPDDESATRLLQHMLAQPQQEEQRQQASRDQLTIQQQDQQRKQLEAQRLQREQRILEQRRKQQLEQQRRREQHRKSMQEQKQYMTVAQNGKYFIDRLVNIAEYSPSLKRNDPGVHAYLNRRAS